MLAAQNFAVLLLAHGTADSIDDIPECLRNVTGGRPVPPQVIEEVKHRYSLIGHSPMNEITARQGELLARELRLPVYVGMRNWKPLIPDVVKKMASDGVLRAVAICLAPQNSRTSAEGDPYERQARETASLVANSGGLKESDWSFAFQSQGMSGGAWLGPTVEETILRLKSGGHPGVFVQPIGFLCDHVEVLYDIDIAFKEFAQKQCMRLWRAASLNESPLLIAALAEIVRSHQEP